MMDEAMLIFTEMQGQGVSPDVFTYSSLIAALCRMDRLDHAIDKFNQMIAMGVQPNAAIYYSLIQGFCRHGDLVKAKELVSEMMKKGIHRPNIVLFRFNNEQPMQRRKGYGCTQYLELGYRRR
jgi:pentatricopeptide repeat protein